MSKKVKSTNKSKTASSVPIGTTNDTSVAVVPLSRTLDLDSHIARTDNMTRLLHDATEETKAFLEEIFPSPGSKKKVATPPTGQGMSNLLRACSATTDIRSVFPSSSKSSTTNTHSAFQSSSKSSTTNTRSAFQSSSKSSTTNTNLKTPSVPIKNEVISNTVNGDKKKDTPKLPPINNSDLLATDHPEVSYMGYTPSPERSESSGTSKGSTTASSATSEVAKEDLKPKILPTKTEYAGIVKYTSNYCPHCKSPRKCVNLTIGKHLYDRCMVKFADYEGKEDLYNAFSTWYTTIKIFYDEEHGLRKKDSAFVTKDELVKMPPCIMNGSYLETLNSFYYYKRDEKRRRKNYNYYDRF